MYDILFYAYWIEGSHVLTVRTLSWILLAARGGFIWALEGLQGNELEKLVVPYSRPRLLGAALHRRAIVAEEHLLHVIGHRWSKVGRVWVHGVLARFGDGGLLLHQQQLPHPILDGSRRQLGIGLCDHAFHCSRLSSAGKGDGIGSDKLLT